MTLIIQSKFSLIKIYASLSLGHIAYMCHISTPVAHSVICLSVLFVLGTFVSPAKMAELAKMLFGGGQIHVGSKNPILDEVTGAT